VAELWAYQRCRSARGLNAKGGGESSATVRSRRPPRNPAGTVSIVLRPEALELVGGHGAGVPARVRTLAYVGPIARYRVVVDGDGTELTVDQSNPGPDQFYAEGTEVRLRLPDEVPSLLS
jgi:ABC-type Fe3+/spermidine/putrescine transport system ATPase subunit